MTSLSEEIRNAERNEDGSVIIEAIYSRGHWIPLVHKITRELSCEIFLLASKNMAPLRTDKNRTEQFRIAMTVHNAMRRKKNSPRVRPTQKRPMPTGCLRLCGKAREASKPFHFMMQKPHYDKTLYTTLCTTPAPRHYTTLYHIPQAVCFRTSEACAAYDGTTIWPVECLSLLQMFVRKAVVR